MMRKYTVQEKEQVVSFALNNGAKKASEHFKIPISTIKGFIAQHKQRNTESNINAKYSEIEFLKNENELLKKIIFSFIEKFKN